MGGLEETDAGMSNDAAHDALEIEAVVDYKLAIKGILDLSLSKAKSRRLEMKTEIQKVVDGELGIDELPDTIKNCKINALAMTYKITSVEQAKSTLELIDNELG